MEGSATRWGGAEALACMRRLLTAARHYGGVARKEHGCGLRKNAATAMKNELMHSLHAT